MDHSSYLSVVHQSASLPTYYFRPGFLTFLWHSPPTLCLSLPARQKIVVALKKMMFMFIHYSVRPCQVLCFVGILAGWGRRRGGGLGFCLFVRWWFLGSGFLKLSFVCFDFFVYCFHKYLASVCFVISDWRKRSSLGVGYIHTTY